jgi:acetyltransferase-like isoleucine patch superfamily enzyme
LVNLTALITEKIGFRTLLKSYVAYSKGHAGSKGRGLSSFLINGKSTVEISKTARIVNNGRFTLGIGKQTFPVSDRPCVLKMLDNSQFIIEGLARFCRGVSIGIGEGAMLKVDGNVFVNVDSKIICEKQVNIGANTSIGWNVEICDSDLHTIVREDYEKTKPILIGSNVWIGSHAKILKGVSIGAGAVIASNAVVTRNVPSGCLAAGVPTKIVKENVQWRD